MTEKDQLIAAVMKSHKILLEKATKAIMESLITHLSKDNKNFDVWNFKKASGYVDK